MRSSGIGPEGETIPTVSPLLRQEAFNEVLSIKYHHFSKTKI
jgi:hypothetical protein